jgi:nitrite reductase (NADH) small subunit
LFIDVAGLGDLLEGQPTPHNVCGRAIVLVRWHDEVFAVRNICPHQSQHFDGGRVHLRLGAPGGPGNVSVQADAPLLQCPMHAWDYDLHTGFCNVDRKVRVRTYATRVSDGRVLVDMDPADKGGDAAGPP